MLKISLFEFRKFVIILRKLELEFETLKSRIFQRFVFIHYVYTTPVVRMYFEFSTSALYTSKNFSSPNLTRVQPLHRLFCNCDLQKLENSRRSRLFPPLIRSTLSVSIFTIHVTLYVVIVGAAMVVVTGEIVSCG